MSKSKSRRTKLESVNQGETLRNMKTPFEQRLEEQEEEKVASLRSDKKTNVYVDDQEEIEDVGRVTLSDLKQADQQRLSLLVNHLLAKNKINAKNAFEVPLIHLAKTNDFNIMESDNSWKKVSSNLENNNKIYGYRVDATHNFTYKVLELITRNERKEGSQEDEEEPKIYKNNQLSLNTQFFSDCLEDYYIKHLEKNQKNINIPHVQAFFNTNPILEKTKRTFDQQGLKALLLNYIGIGVELALLINLQAKPQQEITQKLQHFETGSEQQHPQEIQLEQSGSSPTNSNIFKKIYGICCLNNLVDDQVIKVKIEQEQSEFEMIWRQFQQMTKPKINQVIEIDLENNDEGEIQVVAKEPIVKKQLSYSHENQHEDHQNREEPLNTQQQPQIGETNVGNGQCQKQGPQENVCSEEKPSEKDNNSEGTPQKEAQPVVTPDEKKIDEPQEAVEEPPRDEGAEREGDHIEVITNSDPSNTITQPQAAIPKEVPISSIITFRYFKKNSTSQDPILRQLQVGAQQQQQQGSALQRWKSTDKSSKVIRKPRQKKAKDPKLQQINFRQPLDMRKVQNKRSSILSVDKAKKLQIKKFLKNSAEAYKEQSFLSFNQDKWRKTSFNILTFIRQCLDDRQEQQQESQPCNYPQMIDVEMMNTTTTSAQLRAASIRSLKQKIREYMFDQHLSSFLKIYNRYVSQQGSISPPLCFLTVLHLCNEQGLKLFQKDQNDFQIMSPE